MSVLSVLAKIGKAILGVTPLVLPILRGTGSTLLANIANLIGTAESVGELIKTQGGAKLDKFNAVLPAAKILIRESELVAGREVVDESLFTQGVGDIVNGIVRILKSVSGE